MKVGRYLLFIMVLEIVALCHAAQPIQTVIVGFERREHTAGQTDEVKGTVFYQAPDRFLIKTWSPIVQWSSIQGSKMLIYYPEEASAIEVTAEDPISFPLYQTFVAVLKTDYGLSEAGFELDSTAISGDTLTAWWAPPPAARKRLGGVMLRICNGRLLRMEGRDLKGRAVLETEFSEHVLWQGTYFPGRVRSAEHRDGQTSQDDVRYTAPVFNVPLPDSAAFHLPPNTPVRQLQW